MPGDSICELRNLGPVSAEWLKACGITTIAQLRRIGAVAAWSKVKAQYPKASLNLLWALTAGLDDRDWRSLTELEKQKLRDAVEQ